MASYIALCNFTDQGIRSVKETTHRAEAAEVAARQFGVTIKSVQWTLGAYDLVAQFDAPDEPSLMAFELALGQQGNVRTQTLRAFSRDEMNGILGRLPA